MKKLVFTLAIGIFFVTFANAQTADKKADMAKQTVELVASSDDKAKTECTDKKATSKKATSKKASLRPSSCAEKKSSCKEEKSSCKDKK